MIANNILNKKSVVSDKPNNLCDEDILLQYCKDIDNWPDSWEIDAIDIGIGKAIVQEFKPFLIEKIKKGRAKKTIRTHAGYLWALGGELISQLNQDETERNLPARELILKYIDSSGGPYWHHANDEADLARFDSICRQLFKFMNANLG